MSKKLDKRKKYEEQMQREMEFQFSKFKYTNSIFSIEGCDTKTWFAVEHSNEKGDILNLSEVMVRTLDDFITAGMTLSIQEKITVAQVIPIMCQSLYLPLTLDVMLQIITIQDRFKKAKWYNFYPGILFLGTKLTVTKAVGWKGKYPSVRQEVGQVYYPVMQFHEYTKDDYGLWLPGVVHEDYCDRNFSTAVTV